MSEQKKEKIKSNWICPVCKFRIPKDIYGSDNIDVNTLKSLVTEHLRKNHTL